MGGTMKYLLDRLSERSTWLGIAGLLVLLVGSQNPELETMIVSAGLAVMSVIAVVVKEKTGK